MSADSKTVATEKKCGVIEQKRDKVFLDGVEVYESNLDLNYVVIWNTQFFPTYFDPFYKPILDDSKRSLLFTSKYSFYDGAIPHIIDSQRGNTKVTSEGGEGYSGTGVNSFYDGKPRYDLEDDTDIVGRTVNDVKTGGVVSLEEFPLNAGDKSTMHTERKIVAISVGRNSPIDIYTDCFIGSIEGAYRLSKSYAASEGFTIVGGPIYGFVILRTAPDSRFYMSFERADNGNLVGQVIRTRLMPFLEKARAGETEACLSDGTPVYVSYYDPMGSGKAISKAEFDGYLAIKAAGVRAFTPLPDVLTGLLGF